MSPETQRRVRLRATSAALAALAALVALVALVVLLGSKNRGAESNTNLGSLDKVATNWRGDTRYASPEPSPTNEWFLVTAEQTDASRSRIEVALVSEGQCDRSRWDRGIEERDRRERLKGDRKEKERDFGQREKRTKMGVG